MKKIGLIAGNGNLPAVYAKILNKEGFKVIAIALKEETSSELEKYVDKIHWISVGQLAKLIKTLKNEDISKVIMIGKVKKTLMFRNIKPDLRAMALLAKISNLKDDSILGAVADELAKEGISLEDSTKYLSPMLVEKGILTNRKLTKQEKADVEFGWEIAKEMGRLDIGQSVVIKDKAVLAIEAIEGTDEAIKRGGKLGNGQAVVIKVSKPNQDMRFDVPVIGVNTIQALKDVQASALAVEAGKVIFTDKEEAAYRNISWG